MFRARTYEVATASEIASVKPGTSAVTSTERAPLESSTASAFTRVL